jgi:acyl dehydratase
MTMSMLVEDMKTRGKSLGSPGIDQLRWKHPVFPGDILSVRMEVIDKIEPKSRPDIGFVVSKTTVSTQSGTEVMEFISKGIFPKAGATRD